jgi:hypothetical protein
VHHAGEAVLQMENTKAIPDGIGCTELSFELLPLEQQMD